MLVLTLAGCRTTEDHRLQADVTGLGAVERVRRSALETAEPFALVRASQRLRERLVRDQSLPSPDFPLPAPQPKDGPPADGPDAASEAVPVLSLAEALQVAAANSPDYQSEKESVFEAALALDNADDAFRSSLAGAITQTLSSDLGNDPDRHGSLTEADLTISRTFRSGLAITQQLALDVAKLLSGDWNSAVGLAADVSILFPLMRGAGREAVTAGLTQVQRNLLYAVLNFERYKKEFAVTVATQYLRVLQQQLELRNADENYRRVIASRRRARRLADAGRLPEIQVDQALQDELRARDRWIGTRAGYARQLDALKLTLGLPPDADIALDAADLTRLTEAAAADGRESAGGVDEQVPPGDAPVVLEPPPHLPEGPLGMTPEAAVLMAFERRLDLRVLRGRVEDAARDVRLAADALRPGLDLSAGASLGEGRSVGSAGNGDASVRLDQGSYSLAAELDLPWERTAERNAYRTSLIDLDQARRSLEQRGDRIKLDVRNGLRDLLENTEGVKTQARAVAVARRRVHSTNLFLQAGRAQIRDLLEAEEDLIAAQNQLTAALVSRRLAELELQRDLGVLQVSDTGLWREFGQ